MALQLGKGPSRSHSHVATTPQEEHEICALGTGTFMITPQNGKMEFDHMQNVSGRAHKT